MGRQENVQTIEGIYEAFGRGDVEAILAAVTDDVDWATDSSAALAPWHGERKGKDGVAGFFAGIVGSHEVTELSVLAMGSSEDEVFTFLRYGFRSPATGREGTMNLHHYFRFRDGKIAYVRSSEDTALVAEVLGL